MKKRFKQSNAQVHLKHFIHCISGQILEADLCPDLNPLLTIQFKISQKHEIKKQLSSRCDSPCHFSVLVFSPFFLLVWNLPWILSYSVTALSLALVYCIFGCIAENERTIIGQSHSQVHSKHFIQCISRQTLQPDISPDLNHSLTTQFKNQSKTRDRKNNSQPFNQRYNKPVPVTMRRQNMKELTGGFIPKEQKGENTSTEKWPGESNWESKSDPRWHKWLPNEKPSDTRQKPATVKDAREKINKKLAIFLKSVWRFNRRSQQDNATDHESNNHDLHSNRTGINKRHLQAMYSLGSNEKETTAVFKKQWFCICTLPSNIGSKSSLNTQ